jgi:hypothetical protein
MADLVISGAPVSVLIEHGLEEAVVEKLVSAGIGTVERLGSKTPEELEAIPEIDEETITQIQTAIVSFYGQYEQGEGAEYVEEVAAPAPGHDLSSRDIATGVLEHDYARHESAATNDAGEGEVIDLGQVEGLSAAPSSLEPQTEVEETAENAESANINIAE